MFDENPAPVESKEEPKISLRDFLLAETPLSVFQPPARLLAETWHMAIMDGDPKLRTIEEIFDGNESGVQGFLDGIVNTFTQAEANSLKYQVDAGLIKDPTAEQNAKIARATN